MTMKMWCLCRKKDGRPIKISVDVDWDTEVLTIGFSTKRELLRAIDNAEHDEVIRRIDFEY